MTTAKEFRTYAQQVALLESRGMDVGDPEQAIERLRSVNYYRMSGYWYPFRQFDSTEGARRDEFFPGTTLSDVVQLYEFDARLRAATFAALAPVELRVRALLGHHLGDVDEVAHLRPDLLSARARQGSRYDRWREDFRQRLDRSREDFVEHHRDKYGGVLPIWAAVEILDWGGLVWLFGFSPRGVQDEVAAAFGLRAPQLESWLKSLNIVRNVCAHHGRLFNRAFALMPKLPPADRARELDPAIDFTRSFGQLTLVQYLLRASGERTTLLPAVMRSYPNVTRIPVTHMGTPRDWARSDLWRP